MITDPVEIRLIARQVAENAGLDPDLVCAVCEQESSFNPWAIRFEPTFFDHYIAPQHLRPTEAYGRAFSYGVMQIMGQTARELGFAGQFLVALCDPQTGIEYGCKKLKQCLTRAAGDVTKALLYYNGGGRPEYATEVLARLGGK